MAAIPERCKTCAFREGTAANRSEITMLKAKLCIEICEPFFCHDNVDFVTSGGVAINPLNKNLIDILTKEPQGRYEVRPGETMHLCMGWVDAVSKLNDKGHYANQPEWKKLFTLRLLDIVQRAEDRGAEWSEEETAEQIRIALAQTDADLERQCGVLG
jgi:hypothetical protein